LDYGLVICSVIIYVENRIRSKIIYAELERETGFSIAHIREVEVLT